LKNSKKHVKKLEEGKKEENIEEKKESPKRTSSKEPE